MLTIRCWNSYGISGRYVSIQIIDKMLPLTLCEVQVFAPLVPPVLPPAPPPSPPPLGGYYNLALGRPAYQVSNYSGSPGPALSGPSLAVDGQLARGYSGSIDPSCSHTDKANNPWWFVDLGSAQLVRMVKIFNRVDGYPGEQYSTRGCAVQ